MADIGVHVEDAAERAALEQAAHLLHRRLVTALVADAEHAAGLVAGRQDALGAGGVERQRLLAKHLFTGREGRDRHLLVQRMRRHHRDRVDFGMLEQGAVVVHEVESVRRRKWFRHGGVDVAAGHDFETRAAGKAGDDLLAPPAKPDNADADHLTPFLMQIRADNAGLSGDAQW